MENLFRKVQVFIFCFILTGATRGGNPRVHIETDYGEIVLELFPDKAPRTVKNFLFLVNEQFYTGLTIHRIVPGFVIQGGDNRGNGTGGPGYMMPAEIHPNLKHEEGVVAMARLPDPVNPERKSSGSQFYITVAPAPQLDGKYTIFGKVVKGLEVAKKIVSLPRGPGDKPLQPVIMRKVYEEGNENSVRAPQRCGPFSRSLFFSKSQGEWRLLKDGKDFFTLSTFPVEAEGEPWNSLPPGYFDLYCEAVRQKGKEEPVIVEFTGGAHCCWTYRFYSEKGGKVSETVLDVGNGYEPKFEDINSDGIKEILSHDDRFDYFHDLSHADSPFLPMVICWTGDTFLDCTAQFPGITRNWLEKELERTKKEGQQWDTHQKLGVSLGIFAAFLRLGEREKGWQQVSSFCSSECLSWLKKHEKEITAIASTPRKLQPPPSR